MSMSYRGMFTAERWPEPIVAGAPDAVREAHRLYVDACKAHADAARAVSDARNALRDCDVADVAAATEAITQGRPEPASSRPALELAERAAITTEAATARVAVGRERGLQAAAAAAIVEWLPVLSEQAQEAHTRAHAALDDAALAVGDASDAGATLAWAILGCHGSPPRGPADVGHQLREAHTALRNEAPELVAKRARARLAPEPGGPRATADGVELDYAARIAGVG